jgi:hypothetical protein
VQHHRTLDPRGDVELLVDCDAVIADRAIDAGMRRREIGKLAAEAEAEGADLAVAVMSSTDFATSNLP